ncbi:pantoate--beta-alanine ligase [Wenyingzhuangia marina]|uniref:Pantothenate synthetase n=1 Tax=Wenyingzhuangia marina TaxID=1195760 RepID=A0A1M5T5X9_9FLAO|nr:pantoate--beta-alanine ligase [Wenyingzhuangia marina]GGF65522.1 pantothenate synthetase [Wenyingzhuangia marina]SHH46149.1 pantothenate synthetase [Wenyingzhuangia marina]
MKVFSVKELASSYITDLKSKGLTVGLVPTMGALHKGHLSLINEAKKDNDVVVVSIFVNPTQFNNPADLEKYPRTLEEDLEKLKRVDCDIVFTPEASEMYDKDEVAEIFDFEGLDKEMEGKFRDNHFNGVGTIVKKLFNIITPNNAYFGEKDFQQLQIIKKLVSITKQPVNIIGCAIDREYDGLAGSSRNMRLTTKHRASAPFIYKTITKAKEMITSFSPVEIEKWVENEFKNQPNLELEYFTIADESNLKTVTVFDQNKNHRAFIAVFAGEIRLIDNIAL